MHSPTASRPPRFPSDLRFGSFLVFPAGDKLKSEKDARAFIYAVKGDRILSTGASAVVTVVERLKQVASTTCLRDMFDGSAVLVPTPRSALLMKDAVWPARSICKALLAAGLGRAIL